MIHILIYCFLKDFMNLRFRMVSTLCYCSFHIASIAVLTLFFLSDRPFFLKSPNSYCPIK